MKGVILAAGKATRMRPITDVIPKGLVQVAGKPLLQHNLEALSGSVDEVIIVIGHLGEQIKNHFGDEFVGMKLTYVWQTEQKGTGHALQMIREHIAEDFIVLMGDDIYSKEVVTQLANSSGDSILVAEIDNPERFGVVLMNENIFEEILEKPEEPPTNLVNTGAYRFSKDIFSELGNIELSLRGELELTDALKSLSKKKNIFCVKAEGLWAPIAYPEDIEKFKEIK